jgi:hypothetical protein
MRFRHIGPVMPALAAKFTQAAQACLWRLNVTGTLSS